MAAHHLPTALFPTRERTDPSESDEAESTWAFLERVDDPAFDRVRRLIEAWYEASAPGAGRRELHARLTGGDDGEFHAAWFELYLREVHRRLGFEVVEHPRLRDVTKRPDFRITRDGMSFLLEATVVGDRSDAGRRARRARVVDAINSIRSPDFSLLFEIEQEGDRQPPTRDLLGRLQAWVDTQQWERVRAEQEARCDFARLPRLDERIDDWRFTFLAWPRMAEHRGIASPAIGAGPSDGGTFDHESTLLARLERKGRRYGAPDEPLLLAIRIDKLSARSEDLASALYGPLLAGGRRGRGLFTDASGRARNRQVTGVLAWDLELRPWSVTRRAPVLWLHPDPAHRLAVTLPWRSVAQEAGELRVVEGDFAPETVFELPDAALFDDPRVWPGEPFARHTV